MTLAKSVIEAGKGSGRVSSSALLAIVEKTVAGKALAAQEAGKRSTFLSKNEQLEVGAKPPGVSPFSNWDISPYTVSVSSDMIVDGVL